MSSFQSSHLLHQGRGNSLSRNTVAPEPSRSLPDVALRATRLQSSTPSLKELPTKPPRLHDSPTSFSSSKYSAKKPRVHRPSPSPPRQWKHPPDKQQSNGSMNMNDDSILSSTSASMDIISETETRKRQGRTKTTRDDSNTLQSGKLPPREPDIPKEIEIRRPTGPPEPLASSRSTTQQGNTSDFREPRETRDPPFP